MAVNRSHVLQESFEDFRHAPSFKSLIREIYGTEKIAKNTHNVGWPFSDKTTFEAFQSPTYFLFDSRLRWVTFIWVTRYNLQVFSSFYDDNTLWSISILFNPLLVG